VEEDQFLVGRGEGFRVEWYVEGAVEDRTISFGQELSWHESEWVVDASVRSNDATREHVLMELPQRHAIATEDLLVELRNQTQLLLNRQEEGMRLFLQQHAG
jgi:hypothetical protein